MVPVKQSIWVVLPIGLISRVLTTEDGAREDVRRAGGVVITLRMMFCPSEVITRAAANIK